MSWSALLLLAAGSYALKAIGPLALGARQPSEGVSRLLALVAVPLLSALIVVQTLSIGQDLVIDARVPALVAAAICVWRRAPFLVTVLTAAVVAGAWRALL